jgi:hypothetical protein
MVLTSTATKVLGRQRIPALLEVAGQVKIDGTVRGRPDERRSAIAGSVKSPAASASLKGS